MGWMNLKLFMYLENLKSLNFEKLSQPGWGKPRNKQPKKHSGK